MTKFLSTHSIVLDAEEDEQFNLEEVRFVSRARRTGARGFVSSQSPERYNMYYSDTCKKQKEEVHLF